MLVIRKMTATISNTGHNYVWTGSGYSVETDLNKDGATDSVDRGIVIGAWTSLQNSAP